MNFFFTVTLNFLSFCYSFPMMSSMYCFIWFYFSISNLCCASGVSFGWSKSSCSHTSTFKWSNCVGKRLHWREGSSSVTALSYALIWTRPFRFGNSPACIEPEFGLWFMLYFGFFSGDFEGERYFYFLPPSMPLINCGPFIGLVVTMEEWLGFGPRSSFGFLPSTNTFRF